MWTFFRHLISYVILFLLVIYASFKLYHSIYDREPEPIWKLPNRQIDFIYFILEHANDSNEAILNQRKRLLILYKNFHNHKRISLHQRHWLLNLAQAYKEPNSDFTDDEAWQILIKKVDIVPNSLVIAQAIEETGWGQSRFAKEGNSFFGMRCYGENCGLIPNERGDGEIHKVRTFTNPLQSVSHYMLNLNGLISYSEFRERRAELRKQNQRISGFSLANTLSNYSTNRTIYTDKIAGIIKKYHLDFFDEGQGQEQDLLLLRYEKRTAFY